MQNSFTCSISIELYYNKLLYNNIIYNNKYVNKLER